MSDYRRIIYNGDDEEPDCNRCEHVCDDFDCSGSCGPEHGWYGYERIKMVTNREK